MRHVQIPSGKGCATRRPCVRLFWCKRLYGHGHRGRSHGQKVDRVYQGQRRRRFIVGNAFAFRATDVRELATAVDPVGPENEIHLERIIRDADVLVPCWGAELSCLSLCMFIWTGF
nr:Phage protein [Enterobacter cloacae]